MKNNLADTCCARLPATALPHLSALRACPELRGLNAGESLWLFWPAGHDELARAIQAILGAELFLSREGAWYRPGEHLPVFHIPDAQPARPLSALLFPAPVTPFPPGTAEWQPAALKLVRDGMARPAAAMRLSRTELLHWADCATSYQIAGLQAAQCGEEILLRGPRLPAIGGERFWGRRVFVPLGYRVDPNLAEGGLVSALGLQEGEIAFFTLTGVEVIPGAAFAPLTRSGVRLAGEEPV